MAPFNGQIPSSPTPNLSVDQATICRQTTFASSTGVARGYGGQLRDYLYTNFANGGTTDKNVQIAAEKKLVNKDYRLVRIVEGTASSYTEANKTPHVLRVTYKVGEPYNSSNDLNKNGVDDGNDLLQDNDGKGFDETLAQVYTEVIPGGTFTCGS
jgi:hypothetical protein